MTVDGNEQGRDGSEATFPRKRNGSSAQEDDGLTSKRFRTITEEECERSLLQDMASYPNDNSEKYIPKKDVLEEVLNKTPRPANLHPVKKLKDYLQELLKQKKRPQDIAKNNTL